MMMMLLFVGVVSFVLSEQQTSQKTKFVMGCFFERRFVTSKTRWRSITRIHNFLIPLFIYQTHHSIREFTHITTVPSSNPVLTRGTRGYYGYRYRGNIPSSSITD